MNFLAPLYFAALAALAVPIVLHIIRKQPRNDQVFSSLMFLSPSSPKVTRKSRIDNWPLLLLRAAILGLFAFAFTRPFLPASADIALNKATRFRIVLIDRSASMRRENVWQQAMQAAKESIDDLDVTDSVSVVAFDREPTVLVDASSKADGVDANWRELAIGAVNELDKAGATWNTTDLVAALQSSIDLYESFRASGQALPNTISELVLISDMQSQQDLDRLQEIQWPDGLRLDVTTVAPKNLGNAIVTLLGSLKPNQVALAANEGDSEQAASGDSAKAAENSRLPTKPKFRVRIDNEASSQASSFELLWQEKQGVSEQASNVSSNAKTEKVPGQFEVAAGQTRVLQIDGPTFETGSINLVGDETSFDNEYYFHQSRPKPMQFVYLNDREAEIDREDIGYFLTKLSDDQNPLLPSVNVINSQQLTAILEESIPPALVVANADLMAASAEPLARYVADGGVVMVVLDKQPKQSAEFETWWQRSFNAEKIELSEEMVDDFLLLQKIDYSNRMFAPFNDPKSNDFTKIHFWKARKVAGLEAADWSTLAEFDSGTPALLQRRVGSGSYLLLCSGWQASDSQLALSTKFVPILLNAASRRGRQLESLNWVVGEPIEVNTLSGVAEINGPDQAIINLEEGKSFTPDRPGLYWWSDPNDETRRIAAANLARPECNFSVTTSDQLESYGIRVGEMALKAQLENNARQMRDTELESSQQWWRWLLLAGLVSIVLETAFSVRRNSRMKEPLENG